MADETQNAEQTELESEEAVETQESEETESVEPESFGEEDVSLSDADTDIPEEVDDLVKSERGQKRIRDLAEKAKKTGELEEELESLRDRLVDKGSSKEQATQDILQQLRDDGIPYTGDYLKDLQIVEERATAKALNRFSKVQAKREKFRDDVNSVENIYPELRTGSESFDPELTNDIVSLYKESSNLNPDLELKPFVDRIMKLRQKSITQGSETSVKEIAKQQSESAVTPSKAKKQAKDPKDMTLEELESILPRE